MPQSWKYAWYPDRHEVWIIGVSGCGVCLDPGDIPFIQSILIPARPSRRSGEQPSIICILSWVLIIVCVFNLRDTRSRVVRPVVYREVVALSQVPQIFNQPPNLPNKEIGSNSPSWRVTAVLVSWNEVGFCRRWLTFRLTLSQIRLWASRLWHVILKSFLSLELGLIMRRLKKIRLAYVRKPESC